MHTKVIGAQFIELASVDSTNNYAAEHLSLSELQHGAVILAHDQTAGRGQRRRTWTSSNGLDLTYSIVLRPQGLKAADHFRLGKVAALAVHQTVEEALKVTQGVGGGQVRIKWPNDILVDRQKIAGILIQNDVVGGQVQSAIVGIGLNVNSSELNHEHHATSLRLEVGQPQDRMALLERLCQVFEHWWDLLASDPAQVDASYVERLWARGRYADFELDGQPFTGRPVDVDADGRLLVEGEAGGVLAYGLDRLRFAPR